MATAVAGPLHVEVASAAHAYDPRTGDPVISFKMTSSSARAFAELPAHNVGRKAAILIDGRMVSAPVIREPILGGSGQVSGHFGPEEAREVALRLSSGAAKMEIEIVADDSSGK
jgi:preprotein translocase subunit SecD